MKFIFKDQIAKILIRLWPSYIGLSRVFDFLMPLNPPNDLVVKKLSGFPLKLQFKPSTYLGMFLYYRGMYEEGVIKKLKKLLKPKMTFVDVGANIGLYSVIGAYLVGDLGQVIAFEPQSELKNIFLANLKINRLSNVTLKSTALGKFSGAGKLYQVSQINEGQATLKTGDNEGFFGNPEKVSIQKLSDVLEELGIDDIDGIKIDTEGAELDVLEGFRSHLEKKPPNFILLECIENHLNRFGNDTNSVILFLQQFNYRIYCLYHGRWRSIVSYTDHKNYGFSPDILAVQ
ncbi:MAG: FkbM family methyltransferase [Thermotogota bacterium]|nr:FkbM family methyltransferase [Thermotogota bacterium]